MRQRSPQGPILLLRASLSHQDAEEGGDGLVTMPTSHCPRGGGAGAVRHSAVWGAVGLSLKSPTQGPLLLAQPQASGSTVGAQLASPLLFHTVCSIFAWLSNAWGFGFLCSILSFQPEARAWRRKQAVHRQPEGAMDPPPSLTPSLTHSAASTAAGPSHSYR